MNKKKNSKSSMPGWLSGMTPVQQKAAVILACCALAVIITTVLVVTIVSGAKATPEDVQSSSSSIVPNDFELELSGNDAVLQETADAGDEYLQQTVFVGDSNTVRMNKNGLISLDQYVGKEGMGIQNVVSDKCVFFKGDETAYSIPEALAKMKPRRIVVMLGTNNADGNTSADDFISSYKSALNAIKNAYSYTDIIVSAIPPVPYDHSQYPAITMQTIDSMNQALADLCKEEGYSFLNITEATKDANGYGKDNLFNQGDIHMTTEGLNTVLSYVRTHALDRKDRRPDTNNIPARAEMAASATPAPTPEKKDFTAKYYVEQGTGGTLSSGDKKDQNALSFDVSAKDSVTVTANPKDGFIFVKWSDGKTDATRTDKNFDGNVSVTAQFKAKPSITISPDSVTMKEGEDKGLEAALTGGGKESSIVWHVNGEKKGSGKTFSLKSLKADDDKAVAYEIKASVVIDSKTYEAKITVNVEPKPVEPNSISIIAEGNTLLPHTGGTVILTAKVEPGNATTTFEWSATDVTINANGEKATVTIGPNDTTTEKKYTITARTSNGKTTSSTITVAGKPKPTPTQSPTETPVPSSTPIPTGTPAPTNTPDPTATPESTPESSAAPETSSAPVQSESVTPEQEDPGEE